MVATLQTRKIDRCDKIAVALLQNPGSSQVEIRKITGFNAPYVSRALRNGGMDDVDVPVIDSPDRKWFVLEDDIPTVSKFLVRGLGCPPLDTPPVELPEPGYCAVTGEPLAIGYRAMDIVPAAAGEFLDMLGGNVTGWLSEATAIAFKNTWNLGSRLIFEDGTHYHPLINRSAAQKQDRICWSDLVRSIWPERANQRVLIIVATDCKKRVWHKARIGTFGTRTAVYLHDTELVNASASLWIDWQRLLSVLDFVETVYTAGFSKRGIVGGILSETKAVSAAGLARVIAWEKELRDLRSLDEFKIAIIVAQKMEGKDDSKTEQQELL
jgi:hypothetical protein